MAHSRDVRRRTAITLLVMVAVLVLAVSFPGTHLFILAFAPEPIKSLPINWSRVYVGYHVEVTFDARPQNFTMLVPAPLLDSKVIPQVTRELDRRLSGVTVVQNEHGTFYRLTEDSLVGEQAVVAIIMIKVGERPKRWLFWDNPLEKRFDLSRGSLTDGSQAPWFYVDSDTAVDVVSIKAYLTLAYSLNGGTFDDMHLKLESPELGWTPMKEEVAP